MYWLDNNTGIPTEPTIPPVVSATKRYFTNGGAGVQPSTPEDFWFHMVQEELLGVLTMAGIAPVKDDLGQIAKAIQSIAFSAYPVGSPIPWPTDVPPDGFLVMIGQSFSASTYPKLALAYPSLTLPDMRAYSIRGWDGGRNVDTGRTLLTEQLDALQNITGSLESGDNIGLSRIPSASVGGAFGLGASRPNVVSYEPGAGYLLTFDASRVARTASETRSKNIAFNYIVRAL